MPQPSSESGVGRISMLDPLHRIVKEVNAASDLHEVLKIIVTLVKQAIEVDVCSVYLTDFERRDHVLMATDGLRPEAVGKVRLPYHRGLIGLVCERPFEPFHREVILPSGCRPIDVTASFGNDGWIHNRDSMCFEDT